MTHCNVSKLQRNRNVHNEADLLSTRRRMGFYMKKDVPSRKRQSSESSADDPDCMKDNSRKMRRGHQSLTSVFRKMSFLTGRTKLGRRVPMKIRRRRKSLQNYHQKWIERNVVSNEGADISLFLMFASYLRCCENTIWKPVKPDTLARAIQTRFQNAKLVNQSGNKVFRDLKLRSFLEHGPSEDSLAANLDSGIEENVSNARKRESEDIEQNDNQKKIKLSVPQTQSSDAKKEYDCAESDDSGFDSCGPEVGHQGIVDLAGEDTTPSFISAGIPSRDNETSRDKLQNNSQQVEPVEEVSDMEITVQDDAMQENSVKKQEIQQYVSSIKKVCPEVIMTKSENEKDVETNTAKPQQKLMETISQLLIPKTVGNAKCYQDAVSLANLLKRMIETNALKKFLILFGHSATCKQDQCNKICIMFRRIRQHFGTKPHQCSLITIYGHILRLHVDFCAESTCGLPNCGKLRGIRKNRMTLQIPKKENAKNTA